MPLADIDAIIHEFHDALGLPLPTEKLEHYRKNIVRPLLQRYPLGVTTEAVRKVKEGLREIDGAAITRFADLSWVVMHVANERDVSSITAPPQRPKPIGQPKANGRFECTVSAAQAAAVVINELGLMNGTPA